jgi:hypothetical protein
MPLVRAKKPGRRDHFVEDGRSRLVDGIHARVRGEVEAEFSERIAKANWLKRLVLRLQMRKEVKRRIAEQMPSRKTLW